MDVGVATAGSPPRAGGRSRRRSTGPQRYDFRRPNKLSREHVRALQIANETFARQFTTVLTTTLRAVSTVSLVSVEQLTYDEYVGSLGNPTFAVLAELSPLPGTGVLEFSLPIAMTAVDHLLGGTGGPQPIRPPTEIETTLLRGLVGRVLREVTYAFESLVRLEPQFGRIELNPQFAGIAAPSDLMVVTSFDMRIGAEESVATFCLPYSSLAAVLDEITARNAHRAGAEADDAPLRARLSESLADVPVTVDVRFDPVLVTSGQLLELAPGDVISLAHPLSRPLSVTADGVRCARGVPGSSGRRLAVMIVSQEEDSP